MKPWNAVLFVMLAAGIVQAGEGSWTRQAGKFARFEAPPGMVGNKGGMGVDTIQEGYFSPDITLTFDSETPKLPHSLQKDLERTVAAWCAQRREGEWSKSQYVYDGEALAGAIHGFDDPKDLEIYHLRYYLYLGFAAGDANFSLHIRFRSLDNLDDIERMLKSMRLKTQ